LLKVTDPVWRLPTFTVTVASVPVIDVETTFAFSA